MPLPEKHVSLYNTEQVREICKPLFNKSGIATFHYARLYDNGYQSILVTHPQFHRFFWDNGYDEIFSNYHEGIIFNEQDLSEISEIAKREFDVDHWLMKIKRVGDCLEVVGFATHAGNDAILNYYIQHQDDLDKFVLEFEDKGSYLIKEAEDNKIFTEKYVPKKTSIGTEQFPNKFHIYNFTTKQHSYLTQRQFELLKYLARGLTGKEIAERMNVSLRTIESSINNLKQKLHCYTKCQLINLFHANFH